LTKDKSRWKESIPYVSSLLAHESVKIQEKALWLLGEMGLVYSLSVQDAVPAIVPFFDSSVPLLRVVLMQTFLDAGDIRKVSIHVQLVCSTGADLAVHRHQHE